jgi:hypothetical protein
LIERFTRAKPGAEFSGFCSQAVIIERLHRLLEAIYAGDNFTQTLQLPVIAGTEYFFNGRDQHGSLTGQSKGKTRRSGSSKPENG